MSETQKEMWRVVFSAPASNVFSNTELEEQGISEEDAFDNITFAHTYEGTEEKAIADCMLDYNLLSKCDIIDLYHVSEYIDPDYA